MKKELARLVFDLWMKAKHFDEVNINYKTICPSGYFCHSHKNYLRRLVHYAHCSYKKCPYKIKW